MTVMECVRNPPRHVHDDPYQAWVVPQCGHATLVDTGAMKKYPQEHG
ncbi:MAG: hypothetical protein WBQ21_06800 [Solirubrobacteraceae bacterium]